MTRGPDVSSREATTGMPSARTPSYTPAQTPPSGQARPASRSAPRRVLPGGVVGVLGGGAAGRAIALAARALGYRVRTLDADPAGFVAPPAEHAECGPLTDTAAVVAALAGCDVVTPAGEQVPAPTVAAVEAAGVPVRPAPALLAVAQDRVLEREWLAARGVPLAPWRAAATLDEACAALAQLGGRCILKPALRQGHATGVWRVTTPEELAAAWHAAGGLRCAVEQVVAIDTELSVVVVRAADGAAVTYPAAESRRGDRVGVPRLRWSVIPACGPAAHAGKAERLAAMVAERLRVEGLLAVEMFLLTDGRLVVNELVPCPHPTFAGADQACATGQYEQLVRAVCGLPLGPTTVVRPVAVAPLFGDEWGTDRGPRLEAALGVPGVTLHAYGIESPALDERVGHLAAWGASADQAVRRVLRAHAAIRHPPRPGSGPPAEAVTG